MAASGVPEYHLVREVLHNCQGIDGKYIWYQDDGPDGSLGHFACGPDADISFTQQQLISKITELGWLLRKVKELTVSREKSMRSIVQEALIAAALKELNNYYRLIAILEAQAQKLATQDKSTQDGKGQLSLRRLEVWLSEPLQRLRVLASCLEAAVPLRGGEAINALHSLSKHGDPLFRRVVAPLVDGACIPYFRYIVRWVLDGSLETGLDEFMIVAQQVGADTPSNFWNNRYVIKKSMQPRFISDELAARILTTGKTVAFLRDVCADAEWSEAVAPSALDLETNTGSYRQLRYTSPT